jgi:hypothetical protein
MIQPPTRYIWMLPIKNLFETNLKSLGRGPLHCKLNWIHARSQVTHHGCIVWMALRRHHLPRQGVLQMGRLPNERKIAVLPWTTCKDGISMAPMRRLFGVISDEGLTAALAASTSPLRSGTSRALEILAAAGLQVHVPRLWRRLNELQYGWPHAPSRHPICCAHSPSVTDRIPLGDQSQNR